MLRSFIFAIALGVTTHSIAAAQSKPFYVIGHMTNTVEAVDSALADGANALEIDLKFEKDGDLDDFQHGFPCDCTCYIGAAADPEICRKLAEGLSIPCNGDEDVDTMLNHIAKKPGVYLTIIDSKIGDLSTESQIEAGVNVVDAVVKELFKKGYTGSVIIGAPSSKDHATYIESAMKRSKTHSRYENQFIFSYDMHTDPDESKSAQTVLIGQSKNTGQYTFD